MRKLPHSKITNVNTTNLTKSDSRTFPDELLIKSELAKRLKVSQRKIEMDKGLPKIQWGRSVRYDWAAVCDYLKKK